ncbi:hypothetical protein A6B43_07550 [Vespertiliibacter pulmonis]|uniref:Pyridoxamine 5'-phosphate oxidase putative domain-containing protein n=1 Tax=Vespertiliibacter pulmonis TaxID=1443036 RepID=A0A3N4W8C9_9PAST|nr:hypothetical protein A6B43_07550 [Vespertiliibacter pulmonis]RPE85797.1 hypothetical protein EDC46_0178 [Vespertiliibacter pulmonis]
MTPIPTNIIKFINRHHVVSLACYSNCTIWSASCFYIFDVENNRLLLLTKRTTRHGELMQQNPNIAGTIAGQPEHLNEIEGIQFSATARCLSQTDEKNRAFTQYTQRYPIAKLIPSDVWEICFDEIKFTENRTAFAHKTYWKRTD